MMNTDKKKLKVLVISGGGVYGIIPCYFLSLLNKCDINNIDVFGGTSVGGILTLHLASFGDTQQLYCDFKHNVKNFFCRSLNNIINPFAPKYNAFGIEKVLKQILPLKVCECPRKFVVPSFNFKNITPIIFHNLDRSFCNIHMWKIARSTSAAPTFYPPFSENILIDGGILQNVPIITTASIICKYYNKKPSDLDIFAIGTGVKDKNLKRNQNEVSHYSKLDWAKNIMPIITTGGNEMMSELWGQNMGFNSFKMFNRVVIDGIMDNINKIDIIQQKCQIFGGQFLKQWNEFISR